MNSERADMTKWLESAQADEKNLRSRIDCIKKAISEDQDNSSIHIRELVFKYGIPPLVVQGDTDEDNCLSRHVVNSMEPDVQNLVREVSNLRVKWE